MGEDDTPVVLPPQILPTPSAQTSPSEIVVWTIDETIARHKREIKSFEGDKLAAMKRAKSMGKKAKAAIKEVEFKYDALGRDLMERHRLEMDQLTNENEVGDGIDHTTNIQVDDITMASSTTNATQTIQVNDGVIEEQQLTPEQMEESKRQKILQKKLKKKNAQREIEVNRERRIKEENSLAGPSRKQMEMEALQTLYLHPRALEVQEVEADGNCLYRAVGVQCQRLGLDDNILDKSNNGGECVHYTKIREICANILLGSNRVEYEPFAEYGEGHGSDVGDGGGVDHPATFEEYVHNVRSSSVWGGQLELRALSEGLKRPIVVFSAESPPLIMGAEYLAPTRIQDCGVSGGGNSDDDDWDVNSALLLSFHRHYYALGEHYNSVIPQLIK